MVDSGGASLSDVRGGWWIGSLTVEVGLKTVVGLAREKGAVTGILKQRCVDQTH